MTINLPEGDVDYVEGTFCSPDGSDISTFDIKLTIGTWDASGGNWRTPDARDPILDANNVASCANLKLLVGGAYVPNVGSNVLWAKVTNGIQSNAIPLVEVDIAYDNTTPADPAIDLATRVMLHLTGNRWTWPMRQVTEVYTVPIGAKYINLVGRPISGIVSVVDQFDNAVAAELQGFQLKLNHAGCCFPVADLGYPVLYWGNPIIDRLGQCAREITTVYNYGSRPPADVQRAIEQLAAEIRKADADDGSCKLPERVTNVSRQGVSWTMIDPLDFVDKGRTGLYWPDLVIATYGGKVMKRAKVYSPEHQPPRRIASTVIGTY